MFLQSCKYWLAKQTVANTDSKDSITTSPHKTSSHIHKKEFTMVTTFQHTYAYIPQLKYNNGGMPIKNKTLVFINWFTVNSLYPLIYIHQGDVWRLVNMFPCSFFQFYWPHVPIHLWHMCSEASKMLHLSLIILLPELNYGCQPHRTRKLKVPYWQTMSCYPQTKYDILHYYNGTDNLYSQPLNIKQMM